MRFNAATRCRRLVSLAVAGGFIGAGSGAGASDREGAGAGAGAGTGAEDDVLDAGMATAAHSSAEEALARFSTGEGPQSKLIWEVRARLLVDPCPVVLAKRRLLRGGALHATARVYCLPVPECTHE